MGLDELHSRWERYNIVQGAHKHNIFKIIYIIIYKGFIKVPNKNDI